MTFRQYIRILVIAARSFIAGIVLVFFLPGAGALGDFFAVALTALICSTLTTLVVTTIMVKIKFRDKRHYMRFLKKKTPILEKEDTLSSVYYNPLYKSYGVNIHNKKP